MAIFLFKFLPNAHAQKDSLIPEFPGLTSTYDLSLDLDLGQKESGVVWLRETRSGVRPDYTWAQKQRADIHWYFDIWISLNWLKQLVYLCFIYVTRGLPLNLCSCIHLSQLNWLKQLVYLCLSSVLQEDFHFANLYSWTGYPTLLYKIMNIHTKFTTELVLTRYFDQEIHFS